MSWFSLSRGHAVGVGEAPIAPPAPVWADVRVARAIPGWGLLAVLLAVGIGWLPSLLGHGVVARVSELNHLGISPHPYFQPAHADLLYVITPLVVTSSFLLYLSPGALLVLALGQARSAAEWAVQAFASSLALSVVLGTAAKLVLGVPLTGTVLLSIWLGTTALAALFLSARVRSQATLPWPVGHWRDLRRLLWMLGVCLVGVATLVPKIFWENFNEDGIEAFEFGRSLTTNLLPQWEIKDGVFGFYQNYVLFAYPNHWFTALFGPVEAAARLPFLLYLAVLFAALLLLIEWESPIKLTGLEEGAIWLGLAVYTVVLGFNGTYDPNFADLAEPAAPDTLLVVCLLGTAYGLWTARPGWLALFGLTTYLAWPSGLLLLLLLALATWVFQRDLHSTGLFILGTVIGTGMLLGAAYELVYNPLALGGVEVQYSAKNLLRRLVPPAFHHIERVNLLLFPSGITPALALGAVRRHDPAGRVMAAVTLGYFGILYLQTWTALHQFVPIMVLPLVVFWRLYLRQGPRLRRAALLGAIVLAMVALGLSLPKHFKVNQVRREFGAATAYRLGDYENGYPLAIRHGTILHALLPEDWKLSYPDHPWGMDYQSWIYYATRPKPAGTAINYIVQQAGDPAPAGATRVGLRDGVSAYVQDLEKWTRHRKPDLPGIVVSPLYEPVLRETLQFYRAYAERMQRKARKVREVSD